jgi:hypothetical protein
MQGTPNRRISPSRQLGSFILPDMGKYGPKANKMKEYDDRYVGSREPQTPEIEQKNGFMIVARTHSIISRKKKVI